MPAKMNHYDAALRVCVDSLEAGSIRGRVVSRRLTAPITFGDLGDLLLQVEEVLNRQNFPQAFERTRSFVKNPDAPLPVAADLDSGMTKEEVEACGERWPPFRSTSLPAAAPPGRALWSGRTAPGRSMSACWSSSSSWITGSFPTRCKRGYHKRGRAVKAVRPFLPH